MVRLYVVITLSGSRYLAGVSVRRVEDITEALWGTRVSPSTVSDLNKKFGGCRRTCRPTN